MAHFRGTVEGGRGKASRLGHASTGLTVTANGWDSGVRVTMSVRDGVDWTTITLTGGSKNARVPVTIYEGSIADFLDREGPRG
jgi:hypothetical protein